MAHELNELTEAQVAEIFQKEKPVTINLVVGQLVELLSQMDYKDVLLLIRTVDEEMADWDFTMALIDHFEKVHAQYYEEPTDDAKVTELDGKFQGIKPYRMKDNPLEKVFAEEFANENSKTYPLLEHILSMTNEPVQASDRDWKVANTVIQWLGSHVGQCFLARVLSSPLVAQGVRTRIDEELRKKLDSEVK